MQSQQVTTVSEGSQVKFYIFRNFDRGLSELVFGKWGWAGLGQCYHDFLVLDLLDLPIFGSKDDVISDALSQSDFLSVNLFSFVQIFIDSSSIISQKPSMDQELDFSLVDDTASNWSVSQNGDAFWSCGIDHSDVGVDRVVVPSNCFMDCQVPCRPKVEDSNLFLKSVGVSKEFVAVVVVGFQTQNDFLADIVVDWNTVQKCFHSNAPIFNISSSFWEVKLCQSVWAFQDNDKWLSSVQRVNLLNVRIRLWSIWSWSENVSTSLLPNELITFVVLVANKESLGLTSNFKVKLKVGSCNCESDIAWNCPIFGLLKYSVLNQVHNLRGGSGFLCSHYFNVIVGGFSELQIKNQLACLGIVDSVSTHHISLNQLVVGTQNVQIECWDINLNFVCTFSSRIV